MKRLLALLTIGLALSAGVPNAANAAVSSQAQRATAPVVVATWFSNLHARVGLRESVYVQVMQGKQNLAGARLSVTITYGKHALKLNGTTTNKRGMAWASFTVPRQARGATLWALTTVSYKGHRYSGSNHVKVAK